MFQGIYQLYTILEFRILVKEPASTACFNQLQFTNGDENKIDREYARTILLIDSFNEISELFLVPQFTVAFPYYHGRCNFLFPHMFLEKISLILKLSNLLRVK